MDIGTHSPSPPQAPQSDQVPLSQVRVWVPQLPQPWLAGPAQVWLPQGSHWQLALQVCMPPVPQAWVAAGTQTPCPPQADQSDQTPLAQVRVWVPQLPHAWLEGPAQVWPPQAPHWQAAVQVWVPPLPQACMAVGAQAPWFMHGPKADQVPLLHVRDWVPQLPHAWVAEPEQAWLPHAPQWQEPSQVCMPLLPQVCMAPGAQVPSLAQPDQFDQTPLSQVRDWVPQLPQLWLEGPLQLWPPQVPHRQAAVHDCVPFIPQACTAPGAQPMVVQVPTWPPTVQLSQVPPQGRSQQTPDAQLSPV
jgi:hypothetical protein